MIKWRRQYQEPVRDEALGRLERIDCSGDEDLTVQAYKDDSDINTIVRRFGVTGELPVSSVAPFYGDFSDIPDYATALRMIREASDAFERLPAAVRRRFANDPAELISFLQDDSNLEEARVLGLVPKPAPVEPIAVEPVGEV